MGWENILANTGDFLKNNMGTMASIAGAGASLYGGMQNAKMANIAQKELELGRDSYFRNVLRQDKEDEAISAAAGKVKI